MAEYQIRVTTTGSAGSATGSATTDRPVTGLVYAVKIDYHGSAPGTTTVDLDEVDGIAQKIVDLAAGNTDVTLYPRVEAAANDNTALGTYGHFYIDGRYLQLSVAGSNALTDTVIATLQVLD